MQQTIISNNFTSFKKSKQFTIKLSKNLMEVPGNKRKIKTMLLNLFNTLMTSI
jgi:hypothetical protein